jgi:hypothetical protein
LILTGNVSGPGVIGFGHGGSGVAPNNAVFRLVLSGDNSNWTGGVRLDNAAGLGYSNGGGGGRGLHIRGANSLGTGPVVVASSAMSNITFDTEAAGAVSYSNAFYFAQPSPIAFWGRGSGLSTSGGTASTELTGEIIASTGLIFQGYASSDSQISELVLSGTVSGNGTPARYGYGTSTFAQNFVNGQGGITLGVTQRRDGSTIGNANGVDAPGGTYPGQSTVSNGAEGFVRFNGARSFVPGAVGPGYVAALRLAGAGGDGQFGYLLTGSAGGASYTLPEGKSFVIGSLGTGFQQFGTLGVAGGAGVATLVGSPKLAGFAAGDVNIHANGATDTQSLNLFARSTGDTFQIGTSNTGVVFAPTYGDSGVTSSVTLMAKRTGATTLRKVGAGTVTITNAAFTHVDGTSARAAFSLDVREGTLVYNQSDSGADFAGTTVRSGARLAGGGTLLSAVSASGTVAPSDASVIAGTGIGTLNIKNLTLNSGQVEIEANASASDQLTAGAVNLSSGTNRLTLVALSGGPNGGVTSYTLINGTGRTGDFAEVYVGNTPVNLADAFNGTVGFAIGSGTYYLAWDAPAGGVLTMNSLVPEPGTLSVLGVAAAGLLRRTRRTRRAVAC